MATDSLTVLIEDTALNEITTDSNASFGKERGVLRKTTSSLIPFFIGLSAFLLFGLLRFLYAKHIHDLVNILSRSTLGRMTSKDIFWHNSTTRWIFGILYFICCAFIIGRYIAYFTHGQEAETTYFLWGLMVILGLYILKWFSIHAVALVFRFTKKAKTFFNHLSVVNQLLGFILLPICGAMLLIPSKFSTILLFIGGIILSISLIFKVLINLGYVRNLAHVSFFHFIIYLCTLEIIPMAVCARYVYNGIGA